MNIAEHVGTHPQPVRYYVQLIAGTFRTMLSIGMLVAGTALIGLALAVFLDGFDLVDIGLGLSVGEVLGTFVVLGVVGAFAFGLATEGRYGTAALTSAYPTLEVMIGRMLGGLVVSWIVGWAAGRLESVVADQNLPFRAAQEMIRAIGSAGFIVALLAVPLSWGLSRGLQRAGFDAQVELPVLYVFWAIFALVAFTMPPA